MPLNRLCKAAGIGALLATMSACAAAPISKPIPTTRVDNSSPGTLPEARKYLEGRWTLQSFEVRPPGKAPIVLKGSGLLDYDDFGNLKMEIRADQAASDLLRAAGIDIQDGVISTEGRTAIDIPNRTLTYFLEGQPPQGQGPLATSRPRHWEVTADVLTLTTRDDKGAPLSISVWKRNP